MAQTRQHGGRWSVVGNEQTCHGAESPVLGGVVGVQTGINPPARQGDGTRVNGEWWPPCLRFPTAPAAQLPATALAVYSAQYQHGRLKF